MSADEERPVESVEAWLSEKPYWEQYVWDLNLHKEVLTNQDIDQCYEYLLEHLKLTEPKSKNKPAISLSYENANSANADPLPQRIRINEIKDFKNINAIPEDCSIKFGPNLTLVYGGNGSGKSGIGRLLGNACFARGEREVLPNVKEADVSRTSTIDAGATFVIGRDSGTPTEINYLLGEDIDDLRRFSVFDSDSVLIHLDQSNNVSFTPAQIRIFDKVAETIGQLETKLSQEDNARRKPNLFQAMFDLDPASPTSTFCDNINAATREADFLNHANFDAKIDGKKMRVLDQKIKDKLKLDVPKKKLQLETDAEGLVALRTSLRNTLGRFTVQKARDANSLLKKIKETKAIVESLSVKHFDDGIFKTIGTNKWKSLIAAAKILYEAEKIANNGEEPSHCLLCHQKLTKGAMSLFQNYWQFLENKAETELTQLNQKQAVILQDLRSARDFLPKFLQTDAGIRTLSIERRIFFAKLKVQFASLKPLLDEWISKITALEAVTRSNMPSVNLTQIDSLLAAKVTEAEKLIDPTDEISRLSSQLLSLKHKKQVTNVKNAALDYIRYLNWRSRAARVNFAGIKMTTTKKRTEAFLAGVASNYKGVFNTELAMLGCEFDLVMTTSGEQGDTVKEYRLDFAEEYSPSQILSEGEQNACSLADFLTESQLDNKNCGIIFDDPVTSLDHERKDKIARRLVLEARLRQVAILTHDIVFMSQLVKYADQNAVPFVIHWMRAINGTPGHIEENTSPKLATLATLKTDSQDAIKDIESLGPKEQERALGVALDYLRSACEALIEELLFAKTIQRYDDHIKVQNLEEAVLDTQCALKIVALHGRISESLLAHNRSDLRREDPFSVGDLQTMRKEFDELEIELKGLQGVARKERETRKKGRAGAQAGW